MSPRKYADIDIDLLRLTYNYDPETGAFTYRVRSSNRNHIGDLAGCVGPDGYRKMRLSGRSYGAHRLAYAYMTGISPEYLIDHKNRNPSDNRWENLRLADHSQNMANSFVVRPGKSTPKGVHQMNAYTWKANIKIRGRNKHLGCFGSEAEAQAAYIRELKKNFGDFANTQ